MSLSWWTFGYTNNTQEATPDTKDSVIVEAPNRASDIVKESTMDTIPSRPSPKAAFTVESTALTASPEDYTFDDTTTELSEARGLNAKILANHQKRGASLPLESSKLSSTITIESTLTEKAPEKMVTTSKDSLPSDSPADSRTASVSKEQLRANMSPRLKPRERTNSVTSTTSSSWMQRLNTPPKATAATLSSGISVNGDIQLHPSNITALIGQHDGDSHSVLTASPALSAVDRLTLHRTQSLDLKSNTSHSNDEADPPHEPLPEPVGKGTSGGSGGGDDDDDAKSQKRKTNGDIDDSHKEQTHESHDDVKVSDDLSSEQKQQKPTNDSTTTLWSWFAKPKDASTNPTQEEKPTMNAQPQSSETPIEDDRQPTPSIHIPEPDNNSSHSAAHPSPRNTPESTTGHSTSQTSSSWGFFFPTTSLSDKTSQATPMEKSTSQTESVKSGTASVKEVNAAKSEQLKGSPKLSGIDVDKRSNVSSIKDDTVVKKKGSLSSLTSTSRPTTSQRTVSGSTNAEDKSKQVVIIERSASQDKAGDTASLAPSSEISMGKSTSTKNVVLPTFNSQFKYTPTMEIAANNSTPTTLINKALNAINGLFASKVHKSYSSSDNLYRLRGVREKMANFIQDIQLEPDTVASKRFVVVGVHGSMIGEPTGTSTKFCEQMVKGLRQYFNSTHGISIPDDAITSIPLEGEGKVEDRVQRLYDALVGNSSWLDAISSADVIFWATHSQGTPVSSLLLARLLHEGHIHMGRQQCAMLAMAGISQGPFPALKGNLIVKYFEADAARELFEFMDSSTEISKKFRKSLSSNLTAGVRMVLVGSMQDQVVPLYSAVMSSASHPNLFRAIYIDGHVYNEDDFLINLIIFALRLRNAGVSDHGLLIHVSEVLAGNLYALEGGHSTIYEEVGVYTMAARYLFETPPFGKMTIAACSPPPPPPLAKPEQDIIKAGESAPVYNTKRLPSCDNEEPEMEAFQARLRLNPFYLPWAMRGICDDARILNDKILNQELERLRTLFEKWNPISAKLREIKFRLEPLKARL
ncbi:hypothetical protein K450DRAFT_243700 [Umbelopsis ramanniana AG]|uniref:YMC020W-like alpha/beta hydrolase domain-containing protein n=1 Tax=Umbelopsis ramanniana AG TaxID=1314678 RepID=A0AAD5E907_UMBRA|nr:uncharacterized protein K450DRAFT_243700 [Umbelopsis ramanniana AG]KAI8579067.1 hypothetical protein K450DRAFT_243700 [Umbelopsis ramanniana AG]